MSTVLITENKLHVDFKMCGTNGDFSYHYGSKILSNTTTLAMAFVGQKPYDGTLPGILDEARDLVMCYERTGSSEDLKIRRGSAMNVFGNCTTFFIVTKRHIYRSDRSNNAMLVIDKNDTLAFGNGAVSAMVCRRIGLSVAATFSRIANVLSDSSSKYETIVQHKMKVIKIK